MVSRFFIAIFITAAFSTVGGAADGNTALKPYAEFIAGCLLLQRTSMSRDPAGQASSYRQLRTITGISIDKMLAFLERIRNDPKKGKELYDVMQRVFSEAPDSLK